MIPTLPEFPNLSASNGSFTKPQPLRSGTGSPSSCGLETGGLGFELQLGGDVFLFFCFARSGSQLSKGSKAGWSVGGWLGWRVGWQSAVTGVGQHP